MTRALMGFILGLLVLPVGGLLYFKYGTPPVAAGDPQLPFEAQIVRIPLGARIAREMPATVPIPADDANLGAGAALYVVQCAACHGLPARPSSFAAGMFPHAPQLFARHGDVVGVSDDEAGESYWKIANGIRLTGMPAYKKVLSDNEIWQVTLLVAHADKLSPDIQARLAPK